MSRIEDTCRETLMMESKGQPQSTMRRVSESMVQAQIRRLESHIAALRAENERLKAEIKTEKLIWAVKEDQMRDNFKRCKDAAEHWKKEAETLTADKRELVEALEALYQHTKNNYQICGLNENVKAIIDKHKEVK